jgi:hypothetical protein
MTQMTGDSYLQSARNFVKSKASTTSTSHIHPLPVDAESYIIPFIKNRRSKDVWASTLGDAPSVGPGASANSTLSQVAATNSILDEFWGSVMSYFSRLEFLISLDRLRHLRDASSLIYIWIAIILVMLFFIAAGSSLPSDSDASTREGLPPIQQRPTSRAVLVPRTSVQRLQSAPLLQQQQQQSSVPLSGTALSSCPDSFSATTLLPPPRHFHDNPLMPSSTSVSKSVSARSPHLCAGLVVPHGSECVLALPLLESLGIPPDNHAVIDVKDLEGKTVVTCEVWMPDWSRPGRQTAFEMRTPNQESIGIQGHLIGRCLAEGTPDGRRQTLIFDENGELFAHVLPDPYRPCFVLSGASCPAKIFRGNFDEHVVNVTNDADEPLADTEPCQVKFDPHKPHLKVRVLSGVDVGLVLTGLFAIISLGKH